VNRAKYAVACVAGFLILCANLEAQTDAAGPLHIGEVAVTGTIHERCEDWNWFPSKGQSSYSGSLLRLMFSQKAQQYD